MDAKTLSFHGAIFTGIGIMAFASFFGAMPLLFAFGCGLMLITASIGCLHQSKHVTGIRRHTIFSIGVFGLISLPLVITALLDIAKLDSLWNSFC